MQQYQQQFIDLILPQDNLEHSSRMLYFGDFTLKSGRQSPYFFQAGELNDGFMLSQIGRFMATTIVQSGIVFDGLFGPAYKGIPLVSSVAIALQEQYGINAPWSFNRKVAKLHGEGGNIVGAKLKGRILIIDDVLTAGTAVGQSIEFIQNNAAEPCGVVTLLDRCERIDNKTDSPSAAQKVSMNYQIPVLSIISIYDILNTLQQRYGAENQSAQMILSHLQNYGVKTI